MPQSVQFLAGGCTIAHGIKTLRALSHFIPPVAPSCSSSRTTTKVVTAWFCRTTLQCFNPPLLAVIESQRFAAARPASLPPPLRLTPSYQPAFRPLPTPATSQPLLLATTATSSPLTATRLLSSLPLALAPTQTLPLQAKPRSSYPASPLPARPQPYAAFLRLYGSYLACLCHLLFSTLSRKCLLPLAALLKPSSSLLAATPRAAISCDTSYQPGLSPAAAPARPRQPTSTAFCCPLRSFPRLVLLSTLFLKASALQLLHDAASRLHRSVAASSTLPSSLSA